jgi:hypothetical protein
MYFIIYNFKIIYYKGIINSINRLNKKLNYKDSFVNIT